MIRAEMLDRMSAEELLGWHAFKQLKNAPDSEATVQQKSQQTPQEMVSVLKSLANRGKGNGRNR